MLGGLDDPNKICSKEWQTRARLSVSWIKGTISTYGLLFGWATWGAEWRRTFDYGEEHDLPKVLSMESFSRSLSDRVHGGCGNKRSALLHMLNWRVKADLTTTSATSRPLGACVTHRKGGQRVKLMMAAIDEPAVMIPIPRGRGTPPLKA